LSCSGAEAGEALLARRQAFLAARSGSALIQDRLGQSDEAAAGYPGSAFWMRRYLVALKGENRRRATKRIRNPETPGLLNN
jgi:hypothetical protein